MSAEVKVSIQRMSIDQLIRSPMGNKLQEAVRTLEAVQEKAHVMSEQQDELEITGIRAMTTFIFAVLKKMSEGRKPSELDFADWEDIAKASFHYSVIMSEQAYSVFVFDMYRKYIIGSVSQYGSCMSADTAKAISSLADDLDGKKEQLLQGSISEVTYIEDCLWISLEAMVKLITATIGLFNKEGETVELVQAVATYAFEYGRMVLFQKEKRIITEYLERQCRLDEDLTAEYQAYLEELQERTDQFSLLINNAFADDFRERYMNSIKLAMAAGVPEKELLKNTAEIDAYFIN